MKLPLIILHIYTPMFIKKKALEELFHYTAVAFECEVPKLEGLSFNECLLKYALFTKEEAEKSIQLGHDLQAIKKQLYQNAYQLGEKFRKRFRITTTEEVMSVGKIFYRILGIEFHGTVQGDITISRCFFSQFYSRQVCQVISSLDEGVVAGLSGGGQLVFTQRITESRDCCKADFVLKENPT